MSPDAFRQSKLQVQALVSSSFSSSGRKPSFESQASFVILTLLLKVRILIAFRVLKVHLGACWDF